LVKPSSPNSSIRNSTTCGNILKSPVRSVWDATTTEELPTQILINIKHTPRLHGKQTKSPAIWTLDINCRTRSSTSFAQASITWLHSTPSHFLRAFLPEFSPLSPEMLMTTSCPWKSLAKRLWLNTTILKLLGTHAH